MTSPAAPGIGWEEEARACGNEGSKRELIGVPPVSQGMDCILKGAWEDVAGGTGWHFIKDYFKMQGEYCVSPIKWQRALKCSFTVPGRG